MPKINLPTTISNFFNIKDDDQSGKTSVISRSKSDLCVSPRANDDKTASITKSHSIEEISPRGNDLNIKVVRCKSSSSPGEDKETDSLALSRSEGIATHKMLSSKFLDISVQDNNEESKLNKSPFIKTFLHSHQPQHLPNSDMHGWYSLPNPAITQLAKSNGTIKACQSQPQSINSPVVEVLRSPGSVESRSLIPQNDDDDEHLMRDLARTPDLFDNNKFVDHSKIIDKIVPGMAPFLGNAGLFGEGGFFEDDGNDVSDSFDF